MDQQQYHSQPNGIPTERNAYEHLRSKYQRDLENFRKRADHRSGSNSQNRLGSDEANQRSLIDGTSILSGSILEQNDQSSATQHRRKTSKSVRFQVYDAKNMQHLQKMRTSMQDKLENFRERSSTPTGGKQIIISNIGSNPVSQEGSLLGSLSFKPGQFDAINQSQNFMARKTPRPLKLGQPVSSEESEQNNQSMSISQRNSKRQFDEPFIAGDKSIGDKSLNSAILSDRVLSKSYSKGEIADLVVDQLEDRESKLKKQQAVYKLYDTIHNNKIVGESRHIVDSFDHLKRRSSQVIDLTERSEQKRATITMRAVFRAFREYRRQKMMKRAQIDRAETHNIMRVLVFKKQIMSRMRKVLKFESMWIKEVRYQFAYSLREEVFKSLQLNVKAEKAARLVKMNRYREVLQQFLNLVNQNHKRQAEATEYCQERVMEQVIKRLEINRVNQKVKKAKVKKAETMCKTQLMEKAFGRLNGYYRTRRLIRNDKLLWQAHTSKEEFFNVGIIVGSGMQPLNSRDREEYSDDNEIYAVENVRVQKHDLIQIQLE